MNAYQPKETQTYGYDNTYLPFDPTGTLIFGYDVSANWFTRFNFEASPGTAASSRQFTGKERDSESGLDYFGARYYGSALGRFTSPDDGIDQHADNPQSWNLYGYVRNSPLVNTDPDGEDCVTTSNQTSSSVTVTTERGGSASTCSGTFVDGTVNTNSFQYNGTSLGYSFSNDTASGAGTIQFGQNQSDDDLSPDVANMLHQSGVMAAPLVNFSGQGVMFGARLAFPFTSLIFDAAVGGDPNAATAAGLSRKPGKLGQFKGADSLRKENKIARDIIKQLNLKGKQAEAVHDIIQGASIDAGEKLGFTELLEIVKATLSIL